MKSLGQIHLGEVNEASICYALKYIQKPPKIKKNDKTGRVPEFSLMSKGIGKGYLTFGMVEYHKAANRNYVNVGDGKKQGCPRYYKDKIFNTEAKEQINKQRSIDESNRASRVKNISLYERNKKEYVKSEDHKLKLPSLKNKI